MEDYEWNPRVCFFAKRFAYLNQVLYIYRRRPDSLFGEDSPRIVLNLAKQFRSPAFSAEKQTVSNDILTVWNNQWLSVLFWFMFHPCHPERSPMLTGNRRWKSCSPGKAGHNS